MAVPRSVTSQTDFSAGEPNVEIKRFNENPLHKAGLRQARNVRILNTGGLQQRPGRKILFVFDGRVDEVETSAGVFWRLCFGNAGGLDRR